MYILILKGSVSISLISPISVGSVFQGTKRNNRARQNIAGSSPGTHQRQRRVGDLFKFCCSWKRITFLFTPSLNSCGSNPRNAFSATSAMRDTCAFLVKSGNRTIWEASKDPAEPRILLQRINLQLRSSEPRAPTTEPPEPPLNPPPQPLEESRMRLQLMSRVDVCRLDDRQPAGSLETVYPRAANGDEAAKRRRNALAVN